ncbi:MAG: restriction endonuclease [Anaerolineae bacterium]|nr:restriction endonuclease [Anaerolineae bacterium]
MAFLDDWKISLELLDRILSDRPSLRGILLGFVAEYKLEEIWFSKRPEITGFRRFDNHARQERGDFGFCYKGVPIVVQVKSLQKNSIKRKGEKEFEARFQCDASDCREVILPDKSKLRTTCLVVGGFDLLAVNLFEGLGEWNFAFALAEDLPRTQCTKYTEEQRRHLLATTMRISYPLSPPFYEEPFALLDTVAKAKGGQSPCT